MQAEELQSFQRQGSVSIEGRASEGGVASGAGGEEMRRCSRFTCPTKSDKEWNEALQSPHMHVSIEDCIFFSVIGGL